MVELYHTDARTPSDSQRTYFLPYWVGASLDISVGAEALIKKESLRSDVRKLRKNGLSFRISADESEFQDFYHNMYVPHVTAAHSSTATILSFERAQAALDHSDLLLILYENSTIGGALIAHYPDQSKIWLIGLRQPSSVTSKLGALSAAYFFTVEHLSQIGVASLDMGMTRPFLSDGVMRYKRKWDPQLVSVETTGWLLSLPEDWHGWLAVLSENPFVCVRHDGVWVNLFTEDLATMEEKTLWKLINRSRIKGTAGIQIIDTQGNTESFPTERDRLAHGSA